MKASVIIAAMAHTLSDDEYLYLDLRRIAGKVAMMETVCSDVAADHGCDCDEDDGHWCLRCRARAALE